MKSNQPRTVSLSDLAQLSLRANVAFAVRCAWRLRPCFDLPADAPRRREQMAAVDGALRVAAAFCQGILGEPGRAADAARRVLVVAEETCDDTRFAGYAALRAAEAAAYAEEYLVGSNDSSLTEVIAAAFGAGRVLASNADDYSLDAVAAALYVDVEKLISLAHASGENLGPELDPSEAGPLGPLWPDGTPLWCRG